MKLIVITVIAFVIVALLLYVGTEMPPKWLFLRRHKVHKGAFQQFDITGKDESPARTLSRIDRR